MIRVRIADRPDPDALAAARAELDRLVRPRPTFLGWPIPTAIAIALVLVAIGAAIGLAIPTPDAARCAALNGAPLTADGCRDYLAELDVLADRCGLIADQLTYERCADDVLAAIR